MASRLLHSGVPVAAEPWRGHAGEDSVEAHAPYLTGSPSDPVFPEGRRDCHSATVGPPSPQPVTTPQVWGFFPLWTLDPNTEFVHPY